MFPIYRSCFYKRIPCRKGTIFTPAFFTRFNSACNITDLIRPRRAILYVPGHDRRKIDKLGALDVDCAVLDCEDGVAVNKKAAARQLITEVAENFDFHGIEFAVRINSIESGLAEYDLKAILTSKILPETLMVPKVDDTTQVVWIADELKKYLEPMSKKINVLFFIESAMGLLNMRDICQKAIEFSKEGFFQFVGLVFGSDDFCADIGASRTDNGMELMTARQLFVIVAKSFKLQAIDMVDINYKDKDLLLQNSEASARLGFTGKQVIHPSQVPIVQKAFAPSPEKVVWARGLIELYEQHQNEGKGAFTYKGSMIDRPLLLQAKHIVQMSEALKS